MCIFCQQRNFKAKYMPFISLTKIACYQEFSLIGRAERVTSVVAIRLLGMLKSIGLGDARANCPGKI
jgi:hypothetical protein